jgi:predicted PurR-regulated permease PerM
VHPVAVIFAVMAGGQLYVFFGIPLALRIAAIPIMLVCHVVQTLRASALNGDVDPKEAGSSDKLP